MLIRTLTSIYRVLLSIAYPVLHRARFEDDMLECFEDMLSSARSRRGNAAVILTAVRTFTEMPRSAFDARRAEGKTRGRGSMEKLLQDVRYAIRGLSKEPMFTTLAVLSLGLGVGANTSMFGMINGTLWSDLPVPEGHELVRITEVRESDTQVSFGNFQDIEAQADVFDGVFLQRMETFRLVSAGSSQVVHGEIASANLFDVLGIEPAAGRFFTDDQHGADTSPPVAVMSHYLWSRSFGSDPSVIGSTIEVNELPFTIIGVAPESFHGTKFGLSLDLWIPIGPWSLANDWTPGWREQRGARSTDTFARLGDGVTLEGANAALATIAARMAEEYPEWNATMSLRATPQVAGQIAPGQAGIPNLVGLLAVLGSALVLLVACGNVASLLLARAVARRPEMGVRIALGAGRGRLVRQLLTESLLLAGLGALVGVGIAEWVARMNERFLPNIPYRFSLDTSPDLEVVLFAALVSLAAVLVFGLAPALQASRGGVAGVLRGDDEAAGMKVSGSRLLNAVVVGVVATSFVALFLAGLFGSSLSYVKGLDPGFAKEGRVVATLDFGIAGMDARGALPRHDEVLEVIEALPGVTSAAFTGPIPMGDFSSSTRTYAEDREYAEEDLGPRTWHTSATPEWLAVAGMELVSGRWIGDEDDAEGPSVVVINEALGNVFWPGEHAVGKRIRLSRDPAATSYEVVGVVATAKYMSMVEEPSPAMYFPMEQRPRSTVIIMVTTSSDPATLIGPLREAMRAVDPALTPFDMKTMTDHMQNAYWLYRVGAEIGLALGTLSALLAGAGLYGIMAFRVGRRRREMGIRIALGAGTKRVLRLVMASSLRLVVTGVVIGALVAAAAAGIVQSLVFGVEAGSVGRLLAVALGLTALALVATLAPAMAATRADPVQAIRTE